MRGYTWRELNQTSMGKFCRKCKWPIGITLMVILFALAMSKGMSAWASDSNHSSSDTNTCGISGRVTGSDGGNVSIVEVTAIRDDVAWTSTYVDASGTYTFTWLEAGTHQVIFRPTAGLSNYAPAEYPGRLIVTDGSMLTGIDMVLPLGGKITGRVTSSDGGNIGQFSARIEPMPYPWPYQRGSYTEGNYATAISASGAYTLPNLPAGAYRVHFRRQWLGQSDYALAEYPDWITVTAGSIITGVDMVLQLGGKITGRVTLAQDGTPLGFVDVSLKDMDYYDLPHYLTDSTGVYTLTGVPGGVHRVGFYVIRGYPGWDTLAPEYYNNKYSYATADPVTVSLGAVTSGIDVALDVGGVITGRITSADDGTPLWMGFNVAIFEAASDELISYQTRSTDLYGEYSITGLPTGYYHMWFHPGGDSVFEPEFYDNEPALATATPISVTVGSVTTGIDAALDRKKIVRLATSPALPNVAMAIHQDRPIPRYTLDGGQTWQAVQTTPWAETGIIPQIAVVPRQDPDMPVRLIVAASGELADKIGVFRTGDYGAAWIRYLPPYDPLCNKPIQELNLWSLPDNPEGLYLTRDCWSGSVKHTAYFMSSDSGVSWQELPHSYGGYLPSPSLVRDMHDPNRFYAVRTKSGILTQYNGERSVDGGKTWQPWNEQPCSTSFKELKASPLSTSALLMRCAQGLYQSQDGGDHWARLTDLGGQSLEMDRGNPGRILWVKNSQLWASNGMVSASRDESATWTLLFDWLSEPYHVFLPVITK